jgi:hypothetical protein
MMCSWCGWPKNDKITLTPARHLNPTAPKVCLLDIDGVVVDHGTPHDPRPGIIEKVRVLVADGWSIVAFTSRGQDSLTQLRDKGLILHGYIAKPWASEIMIVDDILSDARNQL